jgi:hypothetical protein
VTGLLRRMPEAAAVVTADDVRRDRLESAREALLGELREEPTLARRRFPQRGRT